MDICAVMAILQIADQIQFKERASILKPMKKILNADLCKYVWLIFFCLITINKLLLGPFQTEIRHLK